MRDREEMGWDKKREGERRTSRVRLIAKRATTNLRGRINGGGTPLQVAIGRAVNGRKWFIRVTPNSIVARARALVSAATAPVLSFFLLSIFFFGCNCVSRFMASKISVCNVAAEKNYYLNAFVHEREREGEREKGTQYGRILYQDHTSVIWSRRKMGERGNNSGNIRYVKSRDNARVCANANLCNFYDKMIGVSENYAQ